MTYRLDKVATIARKLWETGHQHTIWCWYGEMGSGKTTVIKAICDHLGVEDNTGSPTFSIINEYFSPKYGPVYHFDFFRINQPQELNNLGIEEYLWGGQLCLIEWPEIVENILPPDYLEINIKLVGENERNLRIIPHGGANEIST